MTGGLYDGAHCPCPAECDNHGNCKACRAAHQGKGEQTYCEFLARRQELRAARSGREIQLMDYGPCAG
jgi:hypothetical protein